MSKGKRIRGGRYELVEIAGKGGMAVVWRAIQHGDVGFQRIVAVKQMHDHLSESQLYVDMFAEEARVCAAMQSPNLAQVYDFVCEDQEYYLVLEWVDGIDLGSLIRHFRKRDQQMPWEVAAAIGIGVLRALADAHERENSEGKVIPVLHRDISPHNVLVTTRGMVKLIDFGLCLTADRDKELTEPGVVKGKMSYMSPEIVKGERPIPASDQFALGAVLWESLTGKKLFDGESDFDVYGKIRDGQISPLRPFRRDLPKDLVSLIQKSLSTEPEARFPSAREMGSALSTILKKNRASKDLHKSISSIVLDARKHLDMGERTGEASTTTPIADAAIDQVTLPDHQLEIQSLDQARKRRDTSPVEVEAGQAPSSSAEKKGLLHRLPFFGKKR